MKFLSPISTPKPLAPINDQNLNKGRPVFLFKQIFEIRFPDALIVTEVISLSFSWDNSSPKLIFREKRYSHLFQMISYTIFKNRLEDNEDVIW